MRSGFFDNTAVETEDFAAFASGILTNGVTGNGENSLKVTAAGGMKVSIAVGYAWIEGRFGQIEAAETLTLSTADSANPRIDRIVVRLDLSAASINLAVLKGTAAASPSAAALTRDGTVYELCLAEIAVAAGATSITNAVITDTRGDRSLCGAVVANTNDSLDRAGLVEKTELEAYKTTVSERFKAAEERIGQNETDIEALYKKKLSGKALISEAVSGTSSATASIETDGYGVIRVSGTVRIVAYNTSSSGSTTFDKDYRAVLIGTDDSETIVIDGLEHTSTEFICTITVESGAEEVTVSADVSVPSGGSSTFNASVQAVVISSVRGAYIE